ncbi:MAG TPA: DUF4349 domain-containing protein [Planctomycetaceae bacterium]|nr:DUF4349 domain-containing protein [Planctomycetaceae bacterium]
MRAIREAANMTRLALAALLLSLALGCGEAATRFAPETPNSAPKPGAPLPAQPSEELSRRKVIYNAAIDLAVERLSDAAASLDNLVKQHHGLLAESEISSNPHAPRTATWRLRVPVDRFADFVSQVTKLGEPLRNKTGSEDITDKYFDFQVRIENKKVQVERLQKIIKEQTGKISELLEAERELNRVTTELEQLKGTVNLWDNQVALATVNITMHERREPVVADSRSFASSVSVTFRSSVENLLAFLQAVALVLVAIAPWAPLIALLVGGVWLVGRRTLQRAVTRAPGGKPTV